MECLTNVRWRQAGIRCGSRRPERHHRIYTGGTTGGHDTRHGRQNPHYRDQQHGVDGGRSKQLAPQEPTHANGAGHAHRESDYHGYVVV
jgi:hypothetical protein